jgi:hypothetical protein
MLWTTHLHVSCSRCLQQAKLLMSGAVRACVHAWQDAWSVAAHACKLHHLVTWADALPDGHAPLRCCHGAIVCAATAAGAGVVLLRLACATAGCSAVSCSCCWGPKCQSLTVLVHLHSTWAMDMHMDHAVSLGTLWRYCG